MLEKKKNTDITKRKKQKARKIIRVFNNIYMNTFFISKNYIINGKKLDKYQTKAVMCNKDKYLVIAGAGSGKTLTIVAIFTII